MFDDGAGKLRESLGLLERILGDDNAEADLASPGGEFRPFKFGKYAGDTINACDRNLRIVELKNGDRFYVSDRNGIAWEALRRLVETNDPHGYAILSDLGNWRGSFVSANQAVVPTELRREGVKCTSKLSRFIVCEGRSGRFRIVNGR